VYSLLIGGWLPPLMLIVKHGSTMKRIRHKTFATQNFLKWETVRDQAEAFINEIGVENVVSVAESSSALGSSNVVVWYRTDEGRHDA
jgi:hypothetical protein